MNRYIELQRGEYEETPEGVKCLVAAIIHKLPAPQRKKYAAVEHQKHALDQEAELTRKGVDSGMLTAWLNLHAGTKASGKSYQSISKTLGEMQRLVEQYGAMALNVAMLKVTGMASPDKATIPYLKAVLKSQSQTVAAPPVTRPADVPPLPPAARWSATLTRLEQRINRPTFNTWFRTIQFAGVSGDILKLVVPDDVAVYYLEEHFPNVIINTWNEFPGENINAVMLTPASASEQ